MTDPGTGTQESPFHSVETAITAAEGGKNVWLHEGQYVEEVTLTKVRGALFNKILVRPYRGASVTIDCLETSFWHPTVQAHWAVCENGGRDEYVWTDPLGSSETERVTRGAFLETPFLTRPQHTRLVTYHQAGDFRAENELWPKQAESGDNNAWKLDEDEDDPGTLKWKLQGYRDWVYMGPGIWFDDDHRLHIRMSPTHNDNEGVEDYHGPTDPTQVKLALSRETTHTLLMKDCSNIVFQDLTIRFGGDSTIQLRNCCNIAFDHVVVRGASSAIRLEGSPQERNRGIQIRHGEIDGGLPPWFYRSDRKDAYRYTPHVPGVEQVVPDVEPPENKLGSGTSGVLISARYNARRVSVHHCKIFNGHDVYVFGEHMRFHHNWIHNINDDALNFGSLEAGTDDAWVYRNVITQSLTALSFGAKTKVRHVRIFRNLIDLREPTLSIRPETAADDPFRQGQFYKQNGPGEGPIDFWHNTCLVLTPGARATDPELGDVNAAGFSHYRALQSGPDAKEKWTTDPRRSYNNVFIAAYPDPGTIKPIAFLPPSCFEGRSDGNVYALVAPGADHDRYIVTGVDTFVELEGEGGYSQLTPPHEQAGRQIEPPPLQSLSADGRPQPASDDLRHRHDMPQAITMPWDLECIERRAGGIFSLFFGRARGCYWVGWDRMWVGVNAQELFPS